MKESWHIINQLLNKQSQSTNIVSFKDWENLRERGTEFANLDFRKRQDFSKFKWKCIRLRLNFID